MKELIEQIKLKADSIPTNTKENRRAKGVYIDCLMMVKEASKNLVLTDVSGLSPSDEEIRNGADEWVFDINGMKWSNNDDTAGDNYGSFIAGAKWVLSRLSNDR